MDGDHVDLPDGFLARLGVGFVAESVWRVLLECPAVSRHEICRRVGISEVDLDIALESLFSAELIRGGPTPTEVATIDPALAIEAQIARAERDAAEQAAAFATLRAQLPQLASAYAHGRRGAGELPGFEIVVPVADVRRQVILAGWAVRNNIRSIEHGPPDFDVSEGRDMQRALLAR